LVEVDQIFPIWIFKSQIPFETIQKAFMDWYNR